MPILNTAFTGQAPGADGRPQLLPAQTVLALKGPLLQVTVGLPTYVVRELQQRGDPLPTPEVGFALIDTGASCTCVDISVAQNIGAPVIDGDFITSASHQSVPCDVYPIGFEFTGLSMSVDSGRTLAVPLQAADPDIKIIALVGRDLLQHFVFIYNGAGGLITLTI